MDLRGPGICELVAGAADHCLKPWRHAAIRPSEEERSEDVTLRLECRDAEGRRRPERDLELDLFHSGEEVHMTLAWCGREAAPMLWQGRHPVWMTPGSGQRTAPPEDALPLEALARRLRALLGGGERLRADR
jgi:hypothetical protein